MDEKRFPAGPAAVRVAHLLALGTYIAAAIIPVLASEGAGGAPQIRYSTLGDMQDEVFLEPHLAVLWACVLGCVAAALAAPSVRAWGVMSLLTGSVLFLFWGECAADPPTLKWDSVDENGLWVGGMEYAQPATGALLVAATSLLLAVGGVCGLLVGRRRADR